MEQRIYEKEISHELKQSYLDYAMSVIIGRALPDVRDGFKPVHRRVLYAMYELSNTHNKPHKKSARIVGEVLGKYHPHGDTAIYDTLVRMAQDFSLRYPLVDGQGNFGSIDGDNAAAMRYTEVRMAKIAEEMLKDITKETVEFIPNFDNTLKEPVVLPTRIPNLLINGSSGIAVGMATNMPPHNLNEIIQALIYRIDNPQSTLEDIMNIITGPDFPTGALILGKSGIYNAYKTGRGKIKVRAKTQITEINGRNHIIVSEIPYQVNKSVLIEQIVNLVKNKQIQGISNLKDTSDKSGLRIEIELKRDAEPEIVLNQLYQHSQLQTTFGIINIAIENGRPKLFTLLNLLDSFINFRIQIIENRTRYDLRIAQERIHILEGLMIALKNIDSIIPFLKKTREIKTAKNGLQEKYGLSEKQAQAVLEMKLQKLTGIEQEKLEAEVSDIREKILYYNSILNDKQKLLSVIKDELQEISDLYGDERKTKVVDYDGDLDIEDLIPDDPAVLLISNNNYIKRMSLDEYQTQRRGGKGIIGVQTKEKDSIRDIITCTLHDYILFFTEKGRVHWLKAYKIPEASRYSSGKPIVNLLNLQDGDRVSSWMKIDKLSQDDQSSIVFVTKKGIIKKSKLKLYARPRKGGIIAITLRENDQLVDVLKTSGNNKILIATAHGKSIRFEEKEIREISRSGQGVRAIRLKQDDFVVSATVEDEQRRLVLTITEKGYGKLTPFDQYRLQSRGGSGVINIKTGDRNGLVVASVATSLDKEALIISSSGKIIRIPINQISIVSRNTKGVRIMRLNPDEKVIGISLIQKEDSEPDEIDKIVEDIKPGADTNE